MNKEDLKYIKEALKYALNDCPVKDNDHETHFNTFANAINLVDEELYLLNNSETLEQKEYVSFLDWLESDETNNLQLETYSDIAAEYLKTKQS